MADTAWTPRGTMHAWRFLHRPRRSYAGWHITLDSAAAESLAELLERFRNAGIARTRTVPLAQVTPDVLRVPRRRSRKARDLSALKLIYNPAAEAELFRLDERENTLELEMGKASLEEVILAVAAVREGDGDFSLGDPPLWFWWYPRGWSAMRRTRSGAPENCAPNKDPKRNPNSKKSDLASALKRRDAFLRKRREDG